MQMMQIHSRVGTDGVLSLSLPLGPDEADADVLVTIEPVVSPVGESWGDFLSETFGGDRQAQPIAAGARCERTDFSAAASACQGWISPPGRPLLRW